MTTATIDPLDVASEVVEAPKLAVTEYDPTQATLLELKKLFKGVIFPVQTADGMKDAKEAAKKLTKLRTSLETLRKKIKEPALRRSQAIDSEAKALTAEIFALEEPIKEQIRLEEERVERERLEAERKEKERVDGIQKRIAEISAIPAASAEDSTEDLAATLADMQAYEITDDDGFAEFIAEARAARDATLFKLQTMHAASVARDAERAELNRLRAEQAAREEAARLEREELARQKEEFERQKAEFEKMMAAAQAKPETLVEQKPEPDVEDAFPPMPIVPVPLAAPVEALDQFASSTAEDDEIEDLFDRSEHPPRMFIEPTAEMVEEALSTCPEGIIVTTRPTHPGQLPTGYWMDGEYWGPTPAGTDNMAKEFAGQTIKLVPFWSHEKEVRFSIGMEGGEVVYAVEEEDAPLLVANLFAQEAAQCC